MHASLVDAQEDLERYKDALILAENRLERAKREVVLAREARGIEAAGEPEKSDKPHQESEPKQDGADGPGVQVGILLDGMCSAHDVPEMGVTQANGVKAEHGGDDDVELLQNQVRKQEAEIARLWKQKVELRQLLSSLEAKVYTTTPVTPRVGVDFSSPR